MDAIHDQPRKARMRMPSQKDFKRWRGRGGIGMEYRRLTKSFREQPENSE
jgi:hypothetical protein